jgi:pimeloyl-ACP methyl ester carboxylesterase
MIVLHGGPDFDHEYLLPDLDRLAASCRLVYYDQRGRGRSFTGEGPKGVTLASEMEGVAMTLDVYSHVTPSMHDETANTMDRILAR